MYVSVRQCRAVWNKGFMKGYRRYQQENVAEALGLESGRTRWGPEAEWGIPALLMGLVSASGI